MQTKALFIANRGSDLREQSLCFIRAVQYKENYPMYVQISSR